MSRSVAWFELKLLSSSVFASGSLPAQLTAAGVESEQDPGTEGGESLTARKQPVGPMSG